MYFQLQPFSRLMSRIFSVSPARFIVSLPPVLSGHLLGTVGAAAPRPHGARHHGRALARTGTHHGHVTRIELLAHFGEKRATAAHQEIDDVVARRIVERMAVDVSAHALLG